MIESSMFVTEGLLFILFGMVMVAICTVIIDWLCDRFL